MSPAGSICGLGDSSGGPIQITVDPVYFEVV